MNCISLRNMNRYRLIDSLRELGYNDINRLFEMSIIELKQELYNKQ